MHREALLLLAFVVSFAAAREGLARRGGLGASRSQPAVYSNYISQYTEQASTKLQEMLNEEYIALGPDFEAVTTVPAPVGYGLVARLLLWLRGEKVAENPTDPVEFQFCGDLGADYRR